LKRLPPEEQHDGRHARPSFIRPSALSPFALCGLAPNEMPPGSVLSVANVIYLSRCFESASGVPGNGAIPQRLWSVQAGVFVEKT
jgi:hypothetical protein